MRCDANVIFARYEAEKNASIYRDRLLYIASNLAGDNDADLGIPEVPPLGASRTAHVSETRTGAKIVKIHDYSSNLIDFH